MKEKYIMPKINSLSGLKAIAMILIFIQHSPLAITQVDISARMCEVLFIASGFLVGYNHYNDYKTSTSPTWSDSVKYCLKKLLQFYPLYLITLIISFIWKVLFGLKITFNLVITFILDLFLCQAWANSFDVIMSFNGVTWFLSALLFCYFLAPLFLKLMKNMKSSLFFFFLAFGIRFLLEYTYISFPNEYFILHVHSHPVIKSLEFLMGMMLVPLYNNCKNFIKDKNTKSTFILFSFIEILLIIITIYFFIKYNDIWMRCWYVILLCPIIFILSLEFGLLSKYLFSFKPLLLFSKIQMEFYILHQLLYLIIGTVIYKFIFGNLIVETITVFICTIIISYLYKKFFSKKLNGLMNKITIFGFKKLGYAIFNI